MTEKQFKLRRTTLMKLANLGACAAAGAAAADMTHLRAGTAPPPYVPVVPTREQLCLVLQKHVFVLCPTRLTS